jgi:beta-fructofuranosidase
MTPPAPRRAEVDGAVDGEAADAASRAARVALHYRPDRGRFGDPKPIVHDGRAHVYFQTSPRPDGFDTMRWGHVVSEDLLRWTPLPPALEPDAGGPDAYGCWTGCVIREGGRFHAFYTGVGGPDGRRQTVCRAESDDLIVWRKDPANPLVVPGAPFARGERAAWRDPHVRRLPDGGFDMVLTAELDEGPAALRACVARLVSDDLRRWRIDGVLHHPGDVHRCECPELVPVGERFVLLYSDYGVQARVGADPAGPFETPAAAQLDDFRWYAAKTAASGERRLVFAFAFDRIAADTTAASVDDQAIDPAPPVLGEAGPGTPEHEPDDGSPWTWGGVMAFPRELTVDDRGGPALRPAPELKRLRLEPLPLAPHVDGALGTWRVERAGDGVTLDGSVQPGGRGTELAFLRAGRHPEQVELVATAAWPADGHVGLVLYADEDVGRGYRVDLDRARGDLTLRRLIPHRNPASPILQRMPLPRDLPDRVDLRALLDGTLLELFVADRVAFTGRLYERPRDAWWGVATRGAVRLEGVRAWRLALPDAGAAQTT